MRQLKPRYGLTAVEVDKLWGYWYRLGKKGERDLFGSFESFLVWASETNYCDGMWLVKKDPHFPLGPDNATWRRKEELLHGSTMVETPKKHPCPECPQNHYCKAICPVRAKWWDVQMEKVRKGLGV